MHDRILLGLVLAALNGGNVSAGEARCWFERGEVVVSAEVAGIAGDYVLDLNRVGTQLHDTRAQAAGVEVTQLEAEVQVGSLTRTLPIAILDLDARGAGFSTPIAGILGFDVVNGRKLRLQLYPCRIWLDEVDLMSPP